MRPGPTRAVLLALGAVVVTVGCSSGGGASAPPVADDADDADHADPHASDDSDDVTVVSSQSADDPDDLAELVSIAPLIVTGTVTQVERGDLLPVEGDGGAELHAAVVTIEIDRVLSGVDPGPSVRVQEPGWLGDTRLSVDGAPPTEPGDEGIWFLVHDDAPAASPWSTLGRVGRWVVRDDRLVGPRLDIGVAIDLQDRRLAEVVEDVEGMSR